MQTTGHIEPNWDIAEFQQLEYKPDTHKDSALLDLYANSGHVRSSIALYNLHEPSPMPTVVSRHIRPKFDFLDNVAMAVNLFQPGQYLPYHHDLYQRYRVCHNIQQQCIVRCVVMLQDGEPGQMLEIADQVHSRWRAGDWFAWRDQDQHAFYNLSTTDRYAVQVTGTVR